jgi:hypothetical protein
MQDVGVKTQAMKWISQQRIEMERLDAKTPRKTPRIRTGTSWRLPWRFGVLALILPMFVLAVSGCERDVREPGEPRVLAPQAVPQTSDATRFNAPASGLAYFSPNKWT